MHAETGCVNAPLTGIKKIHFTYNELNPLNVFKKFLPAESINKLSFNF